MSYADYLAAKVPTTFRRPIWARFIAALGEDLDGSADGDYVGRGSATLDWGTVARAKAAVKARFPTLAPSDALEQIGAERGMPRGPDESDADFAARLKAAWNTWPWAGTAFGLLSALQAGGFAPDIRIQNALRYALDDGGSLVVEKRGAGEWWIDGDGAFWSRFVVLLSGFVLSISDVIQTGTGTQMYVSGDDGGGHEYEIKISGVGSVDSSATFEWRVDGGAFSASQECTSIPAALGSTGIFVHWDAGAFELSADYTFSTTLIPADGSAQQRRAAQLVTKWKPAHATCAGIFALGPGRTWDSYPAGATWDAQQRSTWDSDLADIVEWST